MSEYRKKLIDRMTRIYGLEDPIVLMFANMCETWGESDWNNSLLLYFVEAHERKPYFVED